jgi:two-component system, chemotaxis family, protein-glutamate methylesterase/glutaminase
MPNTLKPIVVGASAGGVEALISLISALPRDLEAPVFVCLHVSASARSALPNILTRLNSMPAAYPIHGQRIQPGRIYIAPPDHHMLLHDGRIELTRGPKENGTRPAIDPLFRSAAVHYGDKVIGVLLSGSLDDGAHGLHAIKLAGGKALIQDPNNALFPDMPSAAIKLTSADFIGTAAEIGAVLAELTTSASTSGNGNGKARKSDAIETNIAELRSHPDSTKELGESSGFSCPHCAGALWEIKSDGLPRYRCRVGHSYTAKTLLDEQSDIVESALWGAVRALQERADLFKRVARRMAGTASAQKFESNAKESLEQAEAIMNLIAAEIAVAPPVKDIEPELHRIPDPKQEAG